MFSRLSPRWTTLALVFLMIGVVPLLPGQDPNYVLSVPGGSAPAGGTFDTMSLLDNGGSDLKAWSFGICHDSAVLDLTSITSGATTQTVNLGGPPDFESLDLFPGGLTHAVLICFTGCDVLPAGTGYQLVDMTYSVVATVAQTTDICYCETLGSPPVAVLLVEGAGIEIIPTTQCGSVSILAPPPAVSNLSCTASPDPCVCDYDLSWTNNGSYQEIRVLENGIQIDTLPGTATSYSVSLPLGATREYCIVPFADGFEGPATCCTAVCGNGVPADPIANLACSIDTSNCTADLTWSNPVSYSVLNIFIDGVLAQTLPGGSESASVPLPGPGTFEVCVSGTTVCGDPVAQVCCTVQCLEFLRGDCNEDSNLSIADPVFGLEVIFGGGGTVANCDDACDWNDDGLVDVADPVYGLSYLFDNGPAPPPPFLVCGTDPTSESLGCGAFAACP